MSDPDHGPASDTDGPHTGSKVGRVIEEYALDGRGEWLEAMWTADRDERLSLRDLAEEFNRHVLEAAMVEAGMDPIRNEVESAYEALTEDETSSGTRVDVRNRLEWNGVDIDALESDFVTHQSVHTYLRKYREVEWTGSDTDPVERERETIERLQGRARAVAANSVERLSKRGELGVDSFDVLVDIRIICGDCGTQYQVVDLLDAGGCDCG